MWTPLTSHILQSVYQWSCHYLFLWLRSVWDSNTQPSACGANVLIHCATAAVVIFWPMYKLCCSEVNLLSPALLTSPYEINMLEWIVKQQTDKAPAQVTCVTGAEVWPVGIKRTVAYISVALSTPVNQNLAWLCKQGVPNVPKKNLNRKFLSQWIALHLW